MSLSRLMTSAFALRPMFRSGRSFSGFQALLPLVTVVVVSACSDNSAPTPPEPELVLESIDVTPGQAGLSALGQSLTFSAAGRSTTNQAMSGLSFTWQSSNAAVASIAADGVATATGFGTTEITATAQGIVGTASLLVTDCSDELSMEPGEVRIFDVPDRGECGIILPVGAEGDRYRLAVVRPVSDPCSSNNPGCLDEVSVQIRTRAGTASASAHATTQSSAPASTKVPGQSPPTPAWPLTQINAGERIALPRHVYAAARLAQATADDHVWRRQAEAQLLSFIASQGPLEAAIAQAPVSGGRSVGSTGAYAAAPALTSLPDRLLIDTSTASQCTAGTKAVAIKVHEDDHFAFYQDSAQLANVETAVNEAQLRAMGDFYGDYGKPVIDDYFGGVSDIDGNGKVIVFVSPVVGSGTAAFVWSGDFFTQERCAASNQGEYIYFQAGVIRGQDNGNWQSLETLVHEMKHVSSLKKSIDRSALGTGGSAYHPSWIEEGTAEIAGNMATRFAWHAVGGPPPQARANGQMMRETGFRTLGGESVIRPEFYGMAIRLLRTQGHLSSQPNGLTHNPTGASSSHSVYGAGFHFHRWLGDVYGSAAAAPGADASFFSRLNAASVPSGVAGLEMVTGQSFVDLMLEYTIATLFNDDRFDNRTAVPGFTSIDFASGVELFCFALSQGEYDEIVRNLEAGRSPPCTDDDGNFSPSGPNGSYPWPVTAQSTGGNSSSFGDLTFEGTSGNGGVRIHDLVATGTRGVSIEVEVGSQPLTARIILARIR